MTDQQKKTIKRAVKIYGPKITPCVYRTWATSFADGYLWFNLENHTTKLIKLS